MSPLLQVPKTIRAKAKKSLVITYRRTLIRRKIKILSLLVVEKKIKATKLLR